MIETNEKSTHIAGIIPIAGQPLDFEMPWHDSLMPIHDNYHAVEKAIAAAATAGCNTIWLVLHRETQPLIKKKVGEWVYDPKTTWIPPRTFWNKKEIPIYYVGINPRDRKRRDSLAWSCLYGAKVSSYVSLKLSKWVVPKRFLVISPYGVFHDKKMEECRETLRDDSNIMFSYNGKTFKDNEHLPFTFTQKEYEACRVNFREIYSGNDTHLSFSDIFSPIDTTNYLNYELDWHYNITNWQNYSSFIGSEYNKLCTRPKFLVPHKWWGFVKSE